MKRNTYYKLMMVHFTAALFSFLVQKIKPEYTDYKILFNSIRAEALIVIPYVIALIVVLTISAFLLWFLRQLIKAKYEWFVHQAYDADFSELRGRDILIIVLYSTIGVIGTFFLLLKGILALALIVIGIGLLLSIFL